MRISPIVHFKQNSSKQICRRSWSQQSCIRLTSIDAQIPCLSIVKTLCRIRARCDSELLISSESDLVNHSVELFWEWVIVPGKKANNKPSGERMLSVVCTKVTDVITEFTESSANNAVKGQRCDHPNCPCFRSQLKQLCFGSLRLLTVVTSLSKTSPSCPSCPYSDSLSTKLEVEVRLLSITSYS